MCATKQLYEETECEREAVVLWKTGKREQVQLEQTTQIGKKKIRNKTVYSVYLFKDSSTWKNDMAWDGICAITSHNLNDKFGFWDVFLI